MAMSRSALYGQLTMTAAAAHCTIFANFFHYLQTFVRLPVYGLWWGEYPVAGGE